MAVRLEPFETEGGAQQFVVVGGGTGGGGRGGGDRGFPERNGVKRGLQIHRANTRKTSFLSGRPSALSAEFTTVQNRRSTRFEQFLEAHVRVRRLQNTEPPENTFLM